MGDTTDNSLLWAAQTQFPIAPRPFELLGRIAGIAPAEALARLRRLRADGVIRRVGAVFDSRRLGCVSTLVAAAVPPHRLEEVAGVVGASPAATHVYSRRHRYNLWFTLTAGGEVAIKEMLAELRRRAIEELHSLPAERVYKIRAVFAPAGLDAAFAETPLPPPGPKAKPVQLDAAGRGLVRRLAGDLPLVERPFDVPAEELGLTSEELLGQVRAWLAEGVIRRFGAVVSHRRLGYVANGLAVFAVPPERVDEVGLAAAARADVSHCYRRRPVAGWAYNLFAMLHGRSEEQVRLAAADIAASATVGDYAVLMTEREFKKSSPRYFA